MWKIVYTLLTAPFAGLWYLILLLRHFLYDREILPVHSFDFPVVVLGNLTVGGTGKTPLSIYVMQLLKKNGITAALLSRGYGRKTMGYREVLPDERASIVGDEPLQIKRTLGDTLVYVDEDRVHGIHGIMRQNSEVQAVVLDDAFQHRRLVPGVSVVLMRFDRPTNKDFILPLGRLRDLRERLYAADAVVITQCPRDLTEEDKKNWRQDLKLKDQQSLFFSSIEYLAPYNLTDQSIPWPERNASEQHLQLMTVTGIAHPEPFVRYWESLGYQVHSVLFHDHASFDEKAVQKIHQMWTSLGKPELVITEKDAVKLSLAMPADLKEKTFVQPIGIRFLPPLPGTLGFDQWLLSYFGSFDSND